MALHPNRTLKHAMPLRMRDMVFQRMRESSRRPYIMAVDLTRNAGQVRLWSDGYYPASAKKQALVVGWAMPGGHTDKLAAIAAFQ